MRNAKGGAMLKRASEEEPDNSFILPMVDTSLLDSSYTGGGRDTTYVGGTLDTMIVTHYPGYKPGIDSCRACWSGMWSNQYTGSGIMGQLGHTMAHIAGFHNKPAHTTVTFSNGKKNGK